MRRRPAIRKPIGLGLWAPAILLVLSGCAQRAVVEDSLGGFHMELPTRAWLREETLVLEFEAEPREVYAVAHWDRSHTPVEIYSHTFARLDYADDDWPDGLPRRREFHPVPVLPPDRWRRLLNALTEELVPSQPEQGLLLLVQNQQIVVWRDAAGELVSRPANQVPATVEIVNSCDQQAFLERAAGTLDRYTRQLGIDDRHFLFKTERGDRPGMRFVLVDLERRRLVTLDSAVPREVIDNLGVLGLSTQGATSIVLRSHGLTFVKNPLTSLARLVNFAIRTTFNFINLGVRLPRDDLPETGLAAPMDLERWEDDLDELVSSPRYQGTLDLLIDGDAFFSALLDDIGRARESIDLRIYIFDRDDYAISIADILKSRSTTVDVRILIDDMGSLFAGNLKPSTPMSPDFEPPASIVEYLRRDSEIELRRATNPWFTADHTKTLIFDQRIAYTGGMNIGREYRYEWHDMMVRMEGPIAERIGRDFVKAWAHAGWGGDVAYAWRSAFEHRPDPGPGPKGSIDIRPLYTKTAKREVLRAHLEAIRRSSRYIWIQNAYLSEDAIITALIDARRRGVDVRVVLPSDNDSGIMASSNVVTANTLLAHGIRVYAYPGMTHVKAAIFDGWASLGSANFDKLSLSINQEMNVAFSDPATVGRLKTELFEKDFSVSRELSEPIEAGWSDYLYELVADQL